MEVVRSKACGRCCDPVGGPGGVLFPQVPPRTHPLPSWPSPSAARRAERAELSKRLIGESIAKQGVTKDQLTIHSDRGSPMIAKGVAHLLADLGVTKSLSRPHVC
jgi:transposase InsO family protein